MSEPKRYSIVADYQAPWAKMHEFNAGGWVKWEDYARLKAEVERLRASSFVTAVPVEQYERLLKAGDAVCESPYLWETDPAVIAWRAAKEGKKP